MTTKTSFIAIYIKDAHVMCMRIQRPIIAREKHSLYGNAFEMTQHQQHLYECVQPLQGRITFTDNRHDENGNKYRNNFARRSRTPLKENEEGDHIFQRIETLLGLIVFVLVILAIALWIAFGSQYAMNKVFLSQFVVDGASYKMVDAGFTKPVECLAVALLLVSTSLLVGWQNNRGIKRLPNWTINLLLFGITLCQVLAIAIHASTFSEGSSMSFTNWCVLGLHVASFTLTFFIFLYITLSLPEEREDKLFETENMFWLCVVEDLNTIVCYAMIYRACDSQVSVHDDAATFFDVVCIVTIGFLQHIANILMIFHGYIHACGKQTTDNINNIGRTRLLLFFMIGVVTIFLYSRITPTYTEYPAGVPFEMTRSLALIAFISLNSLHSLWYELQGEKTKTVKETEITLDWESSPTWKLMTTAFIALVSAILLVQFVYLYKDDNIFKVLNPS